MVSVEVGGPQESSDGRAAMMSVSDIGAMIATCSGGEIRGVRGRRRQLCKYFAVWKQRLSWASRSLSARLRST